MVNTPALSPSATPMRAALLMLGSTMAFGLMAVAIRYATRYVPTQEVAFFRNAFGLLALLPMLLRPGHAPLKTQQLPRYFVRSAIGLGSMLCAFWALGHLPLAQAVSLSYSTPLFVTIAAVLWLGETVRIRRWAAVVVGFIGVLVIVRPGTAGFTAGSLVAVAAAVLSSLVAIQIKQLTRVDSADTVVLYTYVFWVPLSLVPALFVWVWPSGMAWLWLLATGVLGTVGQLLWTRALRLGEVSALTPISFLQLPLVTLLGWLLFNESVDRWTLIGAGIILAANAYIAHREAVLSRRAASAAASAAAKPAE
ncbi:membrane protein [Stenotrophomonas maltophilia]|uniref:Transmembrane protein n=5 Tax=Lysobacteraceae TaxID=32033 RepID=B2FPI5_STRMK|nr:membrane protein [Stenotrophomonas maltophilia]CAQ45628.1 putative transmembrane protein [Stenotrophomonas maltophilia K279a]